MEKQDKIDLPAANFDHSNAEIFFSDIAELNMTPETVAISFGIKSKDGVTVKVSHTVYLTTPHFFRLTEVCVGLRDNLLTEVKKKAEEFKQAK